MNVAWLEIFREVARHGSLTAAGQALGYTQSAVSRHVAALEQATGACLFERRPRGVRLTEEGHCLLTYAEAILDQLHAARQALSDLRELTAGRLRVGAFDSADAALVPTALAAFEVAHPGVVLTLVEGNTAGQLDRLRHGEIDVAVVSAYPHQPLDSTELDLHDLLEDPLLVALPAGHRLAGTGPLRLAELAGERWIEGFPRSADALTEACLRSGFRPRIDLEVREWTAKQGFVAAGLGLALVPLIAVAAVRPDITLRRLHPDDAPVRTVHAATRRGATNPPAAAAFLACLVHAAGALPGPRVSAEARSGDDVGDADANRGEASLYE